MNSLRPFSKRKAALIASGEVKINGTFKRKSLAEIIAAQAEMKGMVINEVFGPKKQQTSAADVRRRTKEKADKWFSQFIRLRDSDENGIATCVTSGRRMHWTECDCGHYVSRAKEATRYHEQNCHAQSKHANRFQGGHFVEHGNAIDRKYGAGTADKLRQLGLTRCSRTTSDYQFIADTYKSRVDRIKQMEPSKFKTTNP